MLYSYTEDLDGNGARSLTARRYAARDSNARTYTQQVVARTRAYHRRSTDGYDVTVVGWPTETDTEREKRDLQTNDFCGRSRRGKDRLITPAQTPTNTIGSYTRRVEYLIALPAFYCCCHHGAVLRWYSRRKESGTRRTARSLQRRKQLTATPLLVQIDVLSVLDSVAYTRHARQHPSYVERDDEEPCNHERRNVKAPARVTTRYVFESFGFSLYTPKISLSLSLSLVHSLYVCSDRSILSVDFFSSLTSAFPVLYLSISFFRSRYDAKLELTTVDVLYSLVFLLSRSFCSGNSCTYTLWRGHTRLGRHLPAFFPRHLRTWRRVTVLNRAAHNDHELDTRRWGWITKKHLRDI